VRVRENCHLIYVIDSVVFNLYSRVCVRVCVCQESRVMRCTCVIEVNYAVGGVLVAHNCIHCQASC
jgi:hypothetical protein